MPEGSAAAMCLLNEANDYVLLHRDTGLALYTTRAREGDIHLANHKLSVAGERLRYVPAKFFMNHSLVG